MRKQILTGCLALLSWASIGAGPTIFDGTHKGDGSGLTNVLGSNVAISYGTGLTANTNNTTGQVTVTATATGGGGGGGSSPSNAIPATLHFEADGTNVFVNAGAATFFNLIATNSFQLNAPTNAATDGQAVTLRVTQDATGSRACTPLGAFRFGTDITGLTLSTAAGATDFIGLRYNASSNRWAVVSFVRGY